MKYLLILLLHQVVDSIRTFLRKQHFIQIARVADARNLDRQTLRKLVEENIEPPFLGMFGPERVNVLKLNLALDELTRTNSPNDGTL